MFKTNRRNLFDANFINENIRRFSKASKSRLHRRKNLK